MTGRLGRGAPMRAPERRQDEAALERLREHEAALTHRLETARAEAEHLRAEAAADAEAIRKDAARLLEEEVAAAKRDAARALELELSAERERLQVDIRRTRDVAPDARERAVRRAVEMAGGVP